MISLLLGAGFSAPFGVPTMRPFLEAFIGLAKRRYPMLTETLDLMLERAGGSADLEGLLSELGKAADVEGALPSSMSTPAIARYSKDAQSLRAHLLSFVVEMCEQFDRQRVLDVLTPLVTGLGARNAAVLTTNYDRIIEFVCEEHGIAVSDGFERAPGLLVAPWNADLISGLPLAKLHGSVTWYRDATGPLRLDRGYPLPDDTFALSRGGRPLEPLMIVPTLEKMVLQDPYTHLNAFLQETLSRTRLLVVVGNSLRDTHVNGAIKYRAEELAVLVVGRSPVVAASRLGFQSVVTLAADADAFVAVCSADLLAFVDQVPDLKSQDELVSSLRQWAIVQGQRVAEWVGLTPGQRLALDRLATDDSATVFDNLRTLRGVRHPQANRALRRLLSHTDADIRSAAAGMLGLNQATEAINDLSELARTDERPPVRLEAAFALDKIGTREALEQLKRRQTERADDTFVSALLKGATASETDSSDATPKQA